MPFTRVATNLARNQLPRDFMPKFNSFLASVLKKDPTVMKWELETDKTMARGCTADAEKNNYLLVEIASIGVFKTKENCDVFVPEIFGYLIKETGLKEDEIVTQFRCLEPHHVGAKSKTMG